MKFLGISPFIWPPCFILFLLQDVSRAGNAPQMNQASTWSSKIVGATCFIIPLLFCFLLNAHHFCGPCVDIILINWQQSKYVLWKCIRISFHHVVWKYHVINCHEVLRKFIWLYFWWGETYSPGMAFRLLLTSDIEPKLPFMQVDGHCSK